MGLWTSQKATWRPSHMSRRSRFLYVAFSRLSVRQHPVKVHHSDGIHCLTRNTENKIDAGRSQCCGDALRLVWNELGWCARVHVGGWVNTARKSDCWASAVGSFTLVRKQLLCNASHVNEPTAEFCPAEIVRRVFTRTLVHSDTPTKLVSGDS